jgi:hypothetical protein
MIDLETPSLAARRMSDTVANFKRAVPIVATYHRNWREAAMHICVKNIAAARCGAKKPSRQALLTVRPFDLPRWAA